MRNIVLFCLFISLFSCQTKDVKPDTSGLFIKLFGGALEETGYDAIETSDGFVILGSSNSITQNTNNSDIYLVKTDLNGNQVWSKTLGGRQGKAILMTSDGGFIILADSVSAKDSTDFYLIRTDNQGAVIWSKLYGKADKDEVSYSLSISSDGGFLLMGNILYANKASDLYIVKTDANGLVVQERIYGFISLENSLGTVKENSLGDIIWCGTAPRTSGAATEIRVTLANAIGNLKWDYFFGGANNDIGKDIKQVPGGYVVTGTTSSQGNGGSDMYVFKINQDGILQWSKSYGGDKNETGNSIFPTSDNNFIVLGTTESSGKGGKDLFLVKIDSGGNEIWSKTFGGTKDDEGSVVKQTSDGGYLLLGTIQFENNTMITLIKTNSDGIIK